MQQKWSQTRDDLAHHLTIYKIALKGAAEDSRETILTDLQNRRQDDHCVGGVGYPTVRTMSLKQSLCDFFLSFPQ